MKHANLNNTFKPKYRFFSVAATFIFTLFITLTTTTTTPAYASTTCPPPDVDNMTPYLGTWQGNIGPQAITLYVEPHAENLYRVQGYYTRVAEPDKRILIVGEPTINGTFDMEESTDGSNISGLWEISFPSQAATPQDCYRLLQGEWLDGNFENPQPITLQREISW